ncbi:Ig-like domain-containing protein [Mucilaginibacter sp. dw_454]|uniref:Ig-like domain-containing protein n=1 Tax=Mucilaginibacter sp. dw_454 TaxID=2720079 RepID=UPI001BD52FD1|nr:Ig-like domain-containing protein [Mucilaginibacter sp. dw_454]
MTLNKKGLFYGPIFLVFLATLVFLGCAVQQKPQGGPKDLDPPKLLKASPANLTHNFKEKEIRLEFDEYFKLNNPFQEITVFPAPEKNPDIKRHQKTLVIDLKDTLLKNTTYVINFGKAIGDVNENNILKNFTYVFSTGTHIDSLTMSGTVTDNQTQLKVKDATVMLFTLKQDSLLFGKKKPSIYTTTDSVGNFKLSNLKEGDYKIYALKEQVLDKIYDNDAELIGFSSHIIHFSHDTSTIDLKVFKQEPVNFRYLSKQFTNDGGMLFIFNRPLNNPTVKILYPDGLDEQKLLDFSKTRDTLTIYSKNMDFDSVRMAFFDNKKPLDTTYLRKGRKESFTRVLSLKYGTTTNNELKNGTDLKIHTSLPIDSFDPTSITLKEDSNEVKYTMIRDTGIGKTFTIKYPWKQKVVYQLISEEGAFTDIYGDKNKRQIKKFTITKPDNYSSLALTLNLPDTSKMYVVELLNEQGIVLQTNVVSKTKKAVVTYRSLYVGKFGLRVTYDDNKNGKWDSGSIKENRQPENIWVYDKLINIRPNWDSEETVDVPREAITP